MHIIEICICKKCSSQESCFSEDFSRKRSDFLSSVKEAEKSFHKAIRLRPSSDTIELDLRSSKLLLCKNLCVRDHKA